MKKITIGFSRSSGKFPLFSWLIMLFQQNNFSHTYIKYYNKYTDREIVFQASGLQVNFVGYKFFKQKEIVVKEFNLEISDDSFNKVLQYATDRSGEPYSLLQILNTAIYIIFKINLFNNQIIGWDCSKLVASILEEIGYKINTDLDVITPKDLYNYLENYGKT